MSSWQYFFDKNNKPAPNVLPDVDRAVGLRNKRLTCTINGLWPSIACALAPQTLQLGSLWDAATLRPRRRGATQGAIRALDDPHRRQQAFEDYQKDKRAASARPAAESLTATWRRLLKLADHAWRALPLTPKALAALDAAVKAGGYRSVNLLFAAKKEHCRAFEWAFPLQLKLEANHSVTRCMGPSRQLSPLPLVELARIAAGDAPL